MRRFCNCNFGRFDNRLDIDTAGSYKFEFVGCPLRGECPYDRIICAPKFNSNLSERQLQIMKMLYRGMTELQISEKLFLSVVTVVNHRKRALAKLGIHSTAEFMRMAAAKHFFGDE